MMNQDSKFTCTQIKAARLGLWAAILVALCALVYMVALPLTYNFNRWQGIQDYADGFKAIQMFTVIPSIALASAFLILLTCIHYYASQDKRLWSHLGMVFGLVYAIISTANYLIQIIAVTPSLLSRQLDGVTMFAPAYPHSIFYALMGSYLFMCLAGFFVSAVFTGSRLQTVAKWSFIGVGLSGVIILIGAIVQSPLIMPLAGGLWFVSLTTGSIAVAIIFKRATELSTKAEAVKQAS